MGQYQEDTAANHTAPDSSLLDEGSTRDPSQGLERIADPEYFQVSGVYGTAAAEGGPDHVQRICTRTPVEDRFWGSP